MQAAKQVAAIVLIAQALVYHSKKIAASLEQPVERPFFDRLSTACIGSPADFHHHGMISGCEKPVGMAATVVNLATDRNEQVWFCREHGDNLKTLDLNSQAPWQNRPLPRSGPNEFLYSIHQF